MRTRIPIFVMRVTAETADLVAQESRRRTMKKLFISQPMRDRTDEEWARWREWKKKVRGVSDI